MPYKRENYGNSYISGFGENKGHSEHSVIKSAERDTVFIKKIFID